MSFLLERTVADEKRHSRRKRSPPGASFGVNGGLTRNREQAARSVYLPLRSRVSSSSHERQCGAAGPLMGNDASKPLEERTLRVECHPDAPVAGGELPDPVHLMQTIQQQIIPRLVVAHGATMVTSCGDTRLPPTEEEIAELARLAVAQRIEDAVMMVGRLSQQGLSFESLMLGLLAPAARALGDGWLEDELTFAEVTVGLGTLHHVLAALRPSPRLVSVDAPVVVLALASGEQHNLGLTIFAEFLKRVGLSVLFTHDHSETLDLVREHDVMALGFSVSSDRWLKPLSKLMTSAKRHSRNPDLLLLVGGSVDATALAQKVGATYCHDVDAAVPLIEQRLQK